MFDWKNIEYFVMSEFADPLYPGSGEGIDSALVYKLDKMRHKADCPIIIHAKVGGAVDVFGNHGHAPNSFHLKRNGCRAADFHFKTDASPRTQYFWVEQMGFPAFGLYYDWKWNYKLLPIGFHVDLRPMSRLERWVRRDGKYDLWLGRHN